MASSGGDSKFPVPKPPQSGIKTVLQYTGIPPSWLDKRPKVPSRNWLIFLTVTSTVVGYYYYDRRQCNQIRQEYVNKVKYLAEAPLHSLAQPRKVTVYGSKWPSDEEYDRSIKYFRKYVKPILVAAAVDYDMIAGRRYGDLANRIVEDIKARRRLEAGLDPPPPNPMNLPTISVPELRRRELEGGVVIVGRPTFKEFMAGLKRGWTESLDKVDKEEKLSMELASDGRFDEPPEPESSPVDLGNLDDEPIPTVSKLPPSKGFSPFTAPHLRESQKTPSSQKTAKVDPAAAIPPPATIPPHSPLLLVDFENYIGLTQIPHMIWDFFNERYKVRAGAEAAYKLIMNYSRPFTAPPPAFTSEFVDDPTTSPSQPHFSELSASPIPVDLDFGRDTEGYYKKSTIKSFVSEIEKARESYYKDLPSKLEVARALANGTREPTKEERNYPPPTEVQLRAERLKKEMRWRSDIAGWDIIKPEKEVEWDERFRDVLKVFADPRDSEEMKGESS